MDYTVPDATFRAILHDIAAALATRPAGAGQHDQAKAGLDQPSAESNTHHLSQSDPSSVRRLVTTRVERAMQEARLHPNASDEQPTRLNMSNLWVEESTAVLRRPSGKQAGNQAAMPMEQLTKHYCQMAYGSTLYNADALAKDPDLAAAHVRGPKSKQTAHSIHTARSAPFKWAHHP
jgi:acetoin utilization deacetylase AcuC-like enzyme